MSNEGSGIEALVRKEGLVATIPADYLERAFILGLTTGRSASVTNRMDMLLHMARQLELPDDGAEVGRFIDTLCAEAIENGEPFLHIDDDN